MTVGMVAMVEIVPVPRRKVSVTNSDVLPETSPRSPPSPPSKNRKRGVGADRHRDQQNTGEIQDWTQASVPAPAAAETVPSKSYGGSDSNLFNSKILRDVLACLPNPQHEMTAEDAIKYQVANAATALQAFKPTDAIEGMLASQAAAAHFAAMECLSRSMMEGQPWEIASKLRRDAANLMRAMTDMIEALDRKRGKGPQVMRIERVVVQDGGQAIVGNVTPQRGS
jgi:hypothetical protein